MYRIAVCDDEKQILNDICTRVKVCFAKKDLKAEYLCFDDARELMELLGREFIDILFLDIDMPYFSGMDIAGFVLEQNIKSIVVFVTSHDALVYQSFAYKPFGFLRKTHIDEELPDLTERIKKELLERQQQLTIVRGQEITRILLKDIVYIESEGNYLDIFTKKDTIRIRETMVNMERKLQGKGFIRCHKGYLVNSEFIVKICAAEVKVQYCDSDKVIPIGRSYEKDLRKKILEFIRN